MPKKQSKTKRPAAIRSTGLVLPLARRAKIRRTDLWRGNSSNIYQVAEWEIGMTVGDLYDNHVSKNFCTYMRKRQNADIRRVTPDSAQRKP
jgi:hypothetical protein